MKKQFFYFLILVLTFSKLSGQCYTLPSYCTPSFTNVAGFSIGLQNVTIGNINNSSIATGNAPNYYDYTNISTAGTANGSLSISIKNGSGNSTEARIYVDYNNDGQFSTSSPELVWTSTTTTAGATVTGSFTIPSGTPVGVYRIRVTGDLASQPINPCALNYGEVEDYTLVVTGSTDDAASIAHTSPAYFTTGNNNIGFSFVNLSSSTLSSIDIGYKLDNNTPVTQSLTGLSIAPGALYTANFSTQLNISTTGTYNLKAWVNNANGAGTQSAGNDSICRKVIVYCGSALSGTYTIDPAGTGSSNFTSIGAVDTSLRACGISGPVTFNIANGTYTYQLELASISGLSSTNTITFKGVGSSPSNCIITAATNALKPYIVRLNAVSYVTFKNMTLRSTGSSDAWVAHIMNGTNNLFNNCVIEMTGTGASSTNSTFVAAVVNGSLTTLSTSSSLSNNNTFDSCTFNAGYYGLYNSSSNGANAINAWNSKFYNQYYYGLYFNSSALVKIKNNEINMRTNNNSSVGIYLINCNASGANFHEIKSNKILNAGQYGIQFLTSSGSGSANGQVYNNFIGGGFRNTTAIYGISDNSSRYQFYHNSINLDFNSSAAYGIYLSGGSLHDVRNNHLVITGNAIPTAVPFFSTASSYVSNLDYNNYYTNSGFNLVNIGTTMYNASNYRTAFPSGGGTSSINLNPYFVSNTNLHTNNYCNNGVNLSLTTDIDGQTRSNPPDIGADELNSVPGNDLGVMKINTPGFPLNTGSQSINVTIKNYGNNTITSADINYTVNGGTAVTQSWSGSLSPCDTANVTFTTNYNFTNGVNKLMVYTSSPNAGTDSLSLNDTASFTLCPAMSGNYTIGSSGDFSNFSNAVSAMICGGIKGPVTFTADAGTYNEQINIPAIRGSSAANSITFKSASGVASSVKLSFGSTLAAANYTVRIFTNSYVKFKDMSIMATGSTYGTALLLSGNTGNDTFTNVIFEGYNATSNTTNHAVIALSSGSISSFITFNNCKVNNGSYGTYIQSNSSLPSTENLTLSGCTFSNQYAYGMYHQYVNGLILKNNSITTNSTLTTYNGMYNYWIMIANDINRPIITGNKIAGAISGIGMYNQYIGVNSTITTPRRALVANNMIQIGRNASSTYGLRENNGNGVDYIHNSINIGNTQTTNATAAAFLEGNSYGSNVVLNNVFSNYGGGAALRINTVSFYPTCDYNNLYTTGANIAYLNTTAQATLANWQSASSRDAASISTNPVFTSNTNLHSNAAAMDNAGQASSLVTTDIDNQPRCPNGSCPGSTSNPDIGADEYIAVALDASVSTISNTNACSGVSSNVDVIIKNMGTDTLKSATIEWSVDGIAQTPYSWTGLLAQGQLSSSFAIGAFAFTSPSSVVKVWTTAPNSGSDGNNSNDTLQSSPSLLLSGTYTIGGSNPSFPSFTSAAAYLNTNGICGPVIFNVRQGTYTERIQLNAITGSSSANSITFRADPGNTADAEITINNNSAAADNHTIFLNGTSFIIFNGLKITNASPGNGSFGSVIRLAGAQDSVAFLNNIITGPITSSTSQNFAVVNHTNGAANMCNRFMLNNNQVRNGSYGVYMVGNTVSTTFEAKARIINNNINGAYYTGIYSQFQNDIQIINNKVILSTTSQTGSRGIYTISNDLFKIDKNTVNNFGQFGIYLQNANNQGGTGTARSTVNNNMVGGQSTGTSPYGIYFGSSTPTSRLIDIFHNSVSLNSTATGAALFFQNTNAYVTDLDIRNNSFANFNAQGTYVCYYYFSATYPVANLVINYNNYYTTNTNNLMFAIGTTGYNTFNGGTPTYNANSRGGNPNYRNNLTDLHSKPTSTQLNDVGTNLSSVATDIDNDARPISPSTIVDMGADEYNYVPSIGVISIITPTLPVSVGTQDVTLKVQNYSTTTVSSFQVKYKA
ncbi:MAG TPA: GEVED domain-containing protein, partial [Bacteroidia bacterium]